MISQQHNNFRWPEEETSPTPAEKKQVWTAIEKKLPWLKLNSTPMQNTTRISTSATTSAQAVGTTLVAGVLVGGAVLLSIPLYMFSLWVFGASNDVLDKAEGILWISILFVPISCAGAYWLALFRLRSVKSFRTLLETFGFSLVCWLVMPILLGAGLSALKALIGGPWDNIMLVGEAPGLILYIVLMALCTSGIALGAARFFAWWYLVREAHLPSRGWLEFLLVLGSVTLATLLTGLTFVYLAGLSLVPVLGAMLAGIAAWTTYRTLQKV
jgi:hypothetical protein